MEDLFPNYTFEVITNVANGPCYKIINTDRCVFFTTIDDKLISNMKIIHDNFQTIVEFLKLNGFIKHSNYYYLWRIDIDVCVGIDLGMCVIRYQHSEFHCNLDDFYKKMKEILNIESMNKPIHNI